MSDTTENQHTLLELIPQGSPTAVQTAVQALDEVLTTTTGTTTSSNTGNANYAFNEEEVPVETRALAAGLERSAELVGVLAQTAGRPWALRTEAMDVLVAALRDGIVTASTFDDIDSPARAAGGTAVIPLHGVITPNAPGLLAVLLGMGGGLTTFKEQLLEAAADSDVERIVIDVDSPGGLVDLVPETAAIMREVRGEKPITAVANTVAASAAYWLASQADEVVITPSGEIGSIGVYMMHTDESRAIEAAGIDVTLTSAGKFKTEGNPFEPLTDGAKASRQAKVDRTYEMFVEDVAAGRDVPTTIVRNGYGEGRSVLADEAVREGLADRVATLDEVVGEHVETVPLEAPEPVTAEAESSEQTAERRNRKLALL